MDRCTVSLIKGYVAGSTGLHISVFGQSIGAGISGFSFWQVPDDEDCALQCKPPATSKIKCITIKANFTVIVALIFNKQKTIEIGRQCADECCCYDLENKPVAALAED